MPAPQVILLVCSPGAETAEIAHDGCEFIPFREDGHRLVCVPEHTARYLCWNRGFRVLPR